MSFVLRNCAATCAAIVWLTAGLALGQSGPSSSRIQRTQAVDYSLDYGSASVSDAGDSPASTDNADPSWVVRKSNRADVGPMSEPNMGQDMPMTRIPAQCGLGSGQRSSTPAS